MHCCKHDQILNLTCGVIKQGGAKQSQAGAKQGQASSSTDKQATASTSAQAQTPAQPQGAAATKGKPAKQASKVQQQHQQKGASESQATGLPSDVFAHLPQYKVHTSKLSSS